MPTCVNNMVEPQILNFQARYVGILHYRLRKPVRPDLYPEQERMLTDVWHVGRLGSTANPGSSDGDMENFGSRSGERNLEGWRRLGLGAERDAGEYNGQAFGEAELFEDVGELGLECLVSGSVRWVW
jgi:engulfment/cell motility protein 1